MKGGMSLFDRLVSMNEKCFIIFPLVHALYFVFVFIFLLFSLSGQTEKEIQSL